MTTIQNTIFAQGLPCTSRKLIRVIVVESSFSYCNAPKLAELYVEASLDNGTLIFYPPKFPQGIIPGVWRGQMPVLRFSDFKEN